MEWFDRSAEDASGLSFVAWAPPDVSEGPLVVNSSELREVALDARAARHAHLGRETALATTASSVDSSCFPAALHTQEQPPSRLFPAGGMLPRCHQASRKLFISLCLE